MPSQWTATVSSPCRANGSQQTGWSATIDRVSKARLEAFSDGVLAIIITIMVLELRVPHGVDLAALQPLAPLFLSYVLSFVLLGTYWNNHHHLLHATHRVSGGVMWANLHLLFWLSLVPFATGWMGEYEFAALPVALYGFVQLMAGFAYYLLVRQLIAAHGSDSTIAKAIGGDVKGKTSLVGYAIAMPLSFVNPALAFALYVAIAVMWLVPDRRVEPALAK